MPEPAALPAAIDRLRRERRAVILAHWYQRPEIQDLADFRGDSLALAQAARDTDAEVIAFAGVHFMAEVAKILSPERIVVLPDLQAGCSLDEDCPPAELAAWRREHPDHKVVAYINCSAAVKAQADIICTSGNAVKVVESFPADQPLLFAPDRNLGAHIAARTGRTLELWPGRCFVHVRFDAERIAARKASRPGSVFIAHPECEAQVLQIADFVGSTSQMLRFVQDSPAGTIIVGTESGMLHEMRRRAPDKTLLPAPCHKDVPGCDECAHMKRNTLEKLYLCLRDLAPRIEMDEDLRRRALAPLERMLAL
ncbi:MAG: quinolinate synthase NadA [Candidatus Krumholzibacteriota bacterium]|nr:quinolinate synthase NadA [Candidatus Krumholzibacteriota bacterium]